MAGSEREQALQLALFHRQGAGPKNVICAWILKRLIGRGEANLRTATLNQWKSEEEKNICKTTEGCNYVYPVNKRNPLGTSDYAHLLSS